MAIRLSARVAESAGKEIDRAGVRWSLKKGKTIQKMMELARENRDHPIRDFEGPETYICTINVNEAWLETFKEYREHHALPQLVTFFKNSLLRGLSFHLDSLL